MWEEYHLWGAAQVGRGWTLYKLVGHGADIRSYSRLDWKQLQF